MIELYFDSILDIDPYLACPNPRFLNKKLKTELNETNQFKMHCDGCNASLMASRANKYAVATFCVNRGDERLELSMFLPEIRKICEANGKELTFDFDKNQFIF